MDQQFTQTETTSGQSDLMPEDAKKTARKQFSMLGLMFFFGTLIINGIQSIAIAIANAVNPDLLQNMNSYLLIAMIPMYCIAMPLLIFLVHKFVPAVHIQPKKMSVGHWFIVFLISVAGMYISNIIGMILTAVISAIKGSPVSNTMVDISTSTSLWFNLIFMVLLAPIFEEIIFRKLIVDRTVKYGEGTAILFSGLMFGLFHGNLNQFAYAFVLGVIFAFVYVKTGNIRYTVFLHMAVNFMGSVLSILILKLVDYDALMKASADVQYMTTYMTTHLPQLMIYLVYCFALFAGVIAGVVLFFVHLKKMKLKSGEVSIPKGSRFSTTILNVGMMLYLIIWIILIILQLLQ